MNLFKKAAVCTDLHLGHKANSPRHNEDCLAFAEWFVAEAKANNVDIMLFLGDFHHQRNSLNITTMAYSLQILELFNKSFSRCMFIPGNHDLFYKEKRDLSSVAYIKKFENIQLINDVYKEGDTTFVPWLVGDEWKKLKGLKSTYVFGHFELPHFLMNEMVEMPNHGELQREDLGDSGYVLTGHFHKRQNYKNIYYTGNCFAHDYADAFDHERGMTILNWGQAPQYIDWNGGPEYKVLRLSQLLDDMSLINDRTYARVNLDVRLSYEEAASLKETIMQQCNPRELQLIPVNEDMQAIDGAGDITVQSVDSIVLEQIQGIDSEHYDKNVLTEIYRNL
jgi:DNA repair exonuclease SbcCD nuclease subunit